MRPDLPDFLADERKSLGGRFYAQEYECSFEESSESVFRADVIRRAVRDFEEFDFDLDHKEPVREMWKQFKYPDEVKLIGRYVLIGRHASVAIFDASSEASLLRITAPFSSLGVAHIAPAMPLEEAIRTT